MTDDKDQKRNRRGFLGRLTGDNDDDPTVPIDDSEKTALVDRSGEAMSQSSDGALAGVPIDESAEAAAESETVKFADGADERTQLRKWKIGESRQTPEEAIDRADGSGSIDNNRSPARPVVGWVVVIEGPGAGCFRPVFHDRNSIGRDDDQTIPLNFGDSQISRDGHAYIIYDDELRQFHLEDGKKTNLVRLNKKVLSGTEKIKNRDLIRIGETTVCFVPFCNANFEWRSGSRGHGD